jgi:hypothetical protein
MTLLILKSLALRSAGVFARAISAIALLGCLGSLLAQVPSPESVLGHKPGDDFYLANYEESLGYFQKLAASSDKIRLFKVGKTSEGRDWYIAVISSAENLRNLNRYREIARRVALVKGSSDDEARQLARDGKAIVHIDGGLHATEVASAQHTIQLAYNLVSEDNDPIIRRILDNAILVLWFSMNPDGQDAVVAWYRRNLGTPYEVSPLPWLYQKYVGHDNNRDGYMNNMIESQIATRAILDEWFPMILFCHHQTAPFPTRIWLPPFAEPVSSNMSPLMFRWLGLIGSAMAAYLEEHGMPGATQFGKRLDDWSPGYNDGIYNYRNIMAFWTETALYRYATPHFYTVQDFPKDDQALRKEAFYSSPWQGGWWRLGDAVRYMIGASMGTLDLAARYREELIFNRYQAGKGVIERFTREPPFAFIIPQQQRDPQTAALLAEKIRFDGIEVSQATEPFKANGKEYPAGTWVMLMDQPFSNLAKELLEAQHYPDLRESPDAPPQLPYDVAGWTLPFQMGVEVAAVTSPLPKEVRSKFRRLDKVVPPAGSVTGSGTWFVMDNRTNAAFKAVNRIFKAGGRISIANKEMTLGGTRYEPGAFVITGIDAGRMESLASELALKIQATERINEPTTALKATIEGFRVMTMNEAATVGDIFVTATGVKDIIVERHFKSMKDGAIVCNTGHYDCEVNIHDLEKLKKSVREVRANNEEYLLKNGRRIYLLAKGRLVNLAAAEGHPSEVMDMSFANQFMSQLRLAELHKKKKRFENKVYDISKEQDQEIATVKLSTMGINIDKLTPEQEKYLDDYSSGT